MNFYFGENYFNNEALSIWNDLIVTTFGGLLGFGVSLWIYYCQNQRDKNKELETINFEFKDKLKYIKLLIDGVIDSIEKQNINTIEFVEKVRLTPIGISDLKIIASKDIDRLHSIDSSILFLTFRHRFIGDSNWLTDFRNLYNHFDFIHAHLNETVLIYKNYQKETQDQILRFKNIVDNIPDIMVNMGLEIKRIEKEYKNDSRFLFLENSLMKYRELAENKAQISDYDFKFLEPVLLEIIDKYELEFFAPIIMDNCKKARVLLNDIVTNSNETAATFQKSPNLLQDSKEFLKKISIKIG